MKHFFIIFIFLVGLKFSYSQIDTNNLKFNAAMLVHADLEYDFSNSLDSIFSEYYIVKELKHEGITDCIFFEIKVNSKIEANRKWSFILAYGGSEHRFFRLRGFKYNEFNEFYNLILNVGDIYGVDAKRKRKRLKQIAEEVKIEGYDIKAAYKKYYGKYLESLIDETSNYRKLIIRAY